MGRVSSETNVLGTFPYTYVGNSSRLATVGYPNGQTSTYSNFGHAGDNRLQTIHHKYPDSTPLSKFDYTYDSGGNILTWREQADNAPATQHLFDYDAADELTRATNQTTDPTPAILNRYVYTYDRAGNRTGEQIDDVLTGATYNNMNQLVSQQPFGGLLFAGTVNEPATVTIDGKPASVKADNSFSASVPIIAGTNTVTIVAADAGGNSATTQYDVDSSGLAKTFTYDANGNLTSDGGRTFEWDAMNRMIAINAGTHRTEFAYNGVGARVRITEKENSSVVGAKQYVWFDIAVAEERDASTNVVMRRFFGAGFQDQGISYFQPSDHLGSVTSVHDATGIAVAKYEYDPFGRRTEVSGALAATFAFAQTMFHSSSGLSLAVHRAYDPSLGRWISQDPIGLKGGINLYGYAAQSPVVYSDPTGLAIWICVRNAHGRLLEAIGANHTYLFDDRNRTCCGALNRQSCAENGNEPRSCIKVADSDGKEDAVMNCCRGKAISLTCLY